jgi:hypothetical protein
VKFESTKRILPGDTLFVKSGGQYLPALVVENKSSISCVCIPLGMGDEISISDAVFLIRERPPETEILPEDSTAGKTVLPGMEPIEEQVENENASSERQSLPPAEEVRFQERINGRFSISSYNNFSESRKTNVMKYTLSFKGNNLGNSRFSVESHLIFRHLLDQWDEVRENLNSALKIYSLALNYDLNERSSLSIGRRINHRISSMGAIDGIHMESGFGNFYLGAIAGFRPDYLDYGVNFDLPQYGLYIGHGSSSHSRFLETTLAFIEQRNGGEIDRRFIYLQHSESLLNDLYLFISTEISLYEKIDGEARNALNLDNLYLLLRYKLSRKFNVSASYDTRKNVIFFESYKNFIDKLLEEEARQGVRFQANYSPLNHIRLGINTGWRYQKDNLNMAKNLGLYLGIDRITNLQFRAHLNADFLRTSYIESRNFGIRVSKEIISGQFSGDIYYRNVNYQYTTAESQVGQNIMGMNLSFRIVKKLSFYFGYEAIAEEPGGLYNRLNFQIIQRL